MQEKKDTESKALSDFKSAVVYVRKMNDKDIQLINSQLSSTQLSQDHSQDPGEGDPDFNEVSTDRRSMYFSHF